MSSKPVSINFKGGCKDGQILRTDSPDPNEQQQAAYVYIKSKQGTIGHDWYVTPEAAPEKMQLKIKRDGDGNVTLENPGVPLGPQHKYVISDRQETDNELALTLSFDGPRQAIDEGGPDT